MFASLWLHANHSPTRAKARAVICFSYLMTFAGAATADVITALTPLTGVDSFATLAINDNGQVVGHGDNPIGGPTGFLYSDGKLIDFGVLSPTAINDSGQIVGSFITPTGAQHAFLYSNGSVADIGTLGGSFSVAMGINNSGQVVGRSDTTMGGEHAFLYSAGRMVDLGTLGGPLSGAFGINDNGQIVGYADNPGTTFGVPVLYSDGMMSQIYPGPGAATAINDSGQIVGINSPGGNFFQGFLDSGGTITNLGVGTEAFGINNRGEVVGISGYPFGPQYPFLYSDGLMHDLNSFLPPNSGWVLYDAYGINDVGQIVGIGFRNGEEEGFVLNTGNMAIPEPDYLVLFVAGLLVACASRIGSFH